MNFYIHAGVVSMKKGPKKLENETTQDELALVRAVLQKERLHIISLLHQGKKNISELANQTSSDRATVSYHLDVLERIGVVTSNYEMLKPPQSKGKIGRFYTVDRENFSKAILAIKKQLEQMEIQEKKANSPQGP